MKEWDRFWELEREKLGIVSKGKERVLERDKVKVKVVVKEKKKVGECILCFVIRFMVFFC